MPSRCGSTPRIRARSSLRQAASSGSACPRGSASTPGWRSSWRLNLPAPPPASPPDVDEEAHAHAHHGGETALTAPMPGTVLSALAAPGDAVEARQPLVVLEAMKMETPVAAPFAATVKAVHVASGDRVAGGDLLVELEP